MLVLHLQHGFVSGLRKYMVECCVYVVGDNTEIVADFVGVVFYVLEIHFIDRRKVRHDTGCIFQKLTINMSLLQIGFEQRVLIAVQYIFDCVKHL